jgi:hypothetical protein
MSQFTESILPAKFIALILQFILTIVVISTREENVKAGIDRNASKTGSEYTGADNSILAAIGLSIIANVFELVVLFSGFSVLFDKVNITREVYTEAALHSIGVIFISWLIADDWSYRAFWGFWFFFR